MLRAANYRAVQGRGHQTSCTQPLPSSAHTRQTSGDGGWGRGEAAEKKFSILIPPTSHEFKPLKKNVWIIQTELNTYGEFAE